VMVDLCFTDEVLDFSVNAIDRHAPQRRLVLVSPDTAQHSAEDLFRSDLARVRWVLAVSVA
jgi:hypothetical protein